MKKLLALLAVLGMVNVASATVTVSKIDNGIVGGYQKFTFVFSSDSAVDKINAWDLKATSVDEDCVGINVTRIASGLPKFQYGFDYDTNGNTVAGVYSDDTFNLGTNAITFTNTPATAGYTFAKTWQIAWGVPSPIGSYSPVAVLYLKPNTQANFRVEVGSGGLGGAKTLAFDQVVGVPEPATMGLLAIGAMGLLRRKLA